MLNVVDILCWYKTHAWSVALEMNAFGAGNELIRSQGWACSALDANAFGTGGELIEH